MGKSPPFAFLISIALRHIIVSKVLQIPPSNFHFASPPLHNYQLTYSISPFFSLSLFSSFRSAKMGRGSAKPAMAVVFAVVVLTCLMFESQPAQAAIYNVGGPSGWSFNVDSWPKGKTFRAGDVLVFNYDGTKHNVVQVARSGYTGCTSNKGAKVLQSGKDRVKLAKGQNYFICTFTGHCQAGMKIAVNAL